MKITKRTKYFSEFELKLTHRLDHPDYEFLHSETGVYYERINPESGSGQQKGIKKIKNGEII
jgi:hypothetical protein